MLGWAFSALRISRFSPTATGEGEISSETDFERSLYLLLASFRYFSPGERHVRHMYVSESFFLVISCVLRFSGKWAGDGTHTGEYYVQRADCFQDDRIPSGVPKLFYVRLWELTQMIPPLLRQDLFTIDSLKPSITELDHLSHSGSPFVKHETAFHRILSLLLPSPKH